MKLAPFTAVALLLIGAAPHPRSPRPCGDSYTVVRGDTLYSIARRCRGSVARIAAASGLRNPARIEIGQRLVLAGHRRSMPAASGHRAPGETRLQYRMERGDTLYSLARWSRVGLTALLAANPGMDPRRIEIGDMVRLPRGAAPPERARSRERGPSQPQSPPAPRRHADDDDGDKPDAEAEPQREPEPEGM